jgi:hypothetical protein
MILARRASDAFGLGVSSGGFNDPRVSEIDGKWIEDLGISDMWRAGTLRQPMPGTC